MLRKLALAIAASAALGAAALSPTAASAHGWGHHWGHGWGHGYGYGFGFSPVIVLFLLGIVLLRWVHPDGHLGAGSPAATH